MLVYLAIFCAPPTIAVPSVTVLCLKEVLSTALRLNGVGRSTLMPWLRLEFTSVNGAVA